MVDFQRFLEAQMNRKCLDLDCTCQPGYLYPDKRVRVKNCEQWNMPMDSSVSHSQAPKKQSNKGDMEHGDEPTYDLLRNRQPQVVDDKKIAPPTPITQPVRKVPGLLKLLCTLVAWLLLNLGLVPRSIPVCHKQQPFYSRLDSIHCVCMSHFFP